MVHALFLIYSCNCAQCTVDEAVFASVGLTDNGPVWQLLAARVEEAVFAHWPDSQCFEARGCVDLQGTSELEQARRELLQGSNAPNPEHETPKDDEPVAWRTRSHM